MKEILEVRESDSALVQTVTRWTIGDGEHRACPDGFWDLVFYRSERTSMILLTGQTTRAVPLAFSPGDELLTISFRAGTFLPLIPASGLVDHAEILPERGRRFELGADTLEIPSFENAEDLVRALERRGVLSSDPYVAASMAGRPLAASIRTLQRHFLRTTGLPPRAFEAIDRAHRAASWLRAGDSPSVVAAQAGYADQAHLTRSLKRLLGQTPSELRT
jgi:AraC-like DNA-binding protein